MDTWGELLGIVIQSQYILGVEALLSAKVKRLRVGSFSSFNGLLESSLLHITHIILL